MDHAPGKPTPEAAAEEFLRHSPDRGSYEGVERLNESGSRLRLIGIDSSTGWLGLKRLAAGWIVTEWSLCKPV